MNKTLIRLAFLLLLSLAPIASNPSSPGARAESLTPSTRQPSSPPPYFVFLPSIFVVGHTYLPVIMTNNPPVKLGPEAGYVIEVVINPQQTNIMYIGSWGAGVFRSLDGGSSWYPANNGLGNLYINAMAIDPTNPAVIYAGTYRDEIYKSTDNGMTWSHINQGIQNGAIVYTIAVDPQNSQNIYIGTRGPDSYNTPPWYGVVYRSTDGGTTWNSVLSNVGGVDDQDWAYSLAVLPQKPGEILAAMHEHGPWLSTDYGKTWTAVPNRIGDFSGRAVVFDPRYASPATAYYGVWHRTGVYKTTNDGQSWILKDNGSSGTSIYAMAIDPVSPSTLYAATFGDGVLKTSNGGDSWGSVGLSFTDVYSVAVNPQNNAIVFGGTAGSGLYKSTNGGASWAPSEKGFNNTNVTQVFARSDSGQTLMMSTYGNGVLESTDSGATWSPLNAGLDDRFVHNLVEVPNNPNLFFALTDTGGLYRLDLSTSSRWVKVSDSVPSPASAAPAFGDNHPFAEHAPMVSDVGESYGPRAMVSLPSSAPLLALAFAPSDPQIAYLGTSGAGLYKSTDGGAHWSASGLDNLTVWSLAVDPGDANRVYAAADAHGLVKTSQDGGTTWTDDPLPGSPDVYTVAASTAEPGTVYAGTNNGVFRQVKGGDWAQIGLAGQQVTALAPHPTRAMSLIAGTASGAFSTDNGGKDWAAVGDVLSGLTIQSITFSIKNPDEVYYASKTSGALRLTFH